MEKLLNWLNDKILPLLVSALLIFIPLYPKLPTIGIPHTWVYIRLEDFLVLLTVCVWFLLLIKKKVFLPKVISLPVFIYWSVGLVSTVIAIFFIFPTLANVFPTVALFHYVRRIEYLILIFVAASTIRKPGDINKYIFFICLAMVGVVLYGFGQRFLGLPAFLTMNEEFAKGVPLRLPVGARITSTFGGHYDLAAYLVMTITLLGSLTLGVKNLFARFFLLTVTFLGLCLLLFTASRVSFAVYLVAICFMLFLSKRKLLIIPVVILSFLLLGQVKGTVERFAKTIRIQPIVINSKTGQPIAVLEELPSGISGANPTPVPYENLPLGTGYIGLPPSSENSEATNVATIRRAISTELRLSTVSSEISTISGSFLIQKALVYDISFTTRLQGGWPRAIRAFNKNIVTGTGYSSIDLASDNDYLRLLGETGILGFFSYLFIFFAYFLMYVRLIKHVAGSLAKSFVIGVTAGLLGLFLNAILIDVFEASKVAYMMYMFMGLSVGLLLLNFREKINLLQELKKFLTSNVMIAVYLLLLTFFVYFKMLNYYFAGDDFVWLKWAAESKFSDLSTYFTNASGFFYRPLPKLLYFMTYAVFWLKPFGYHLVSLFLYFSISVLVYHLAKLYLKNKTMAALSAVLMIFLPINTESVMWVSSYSGLLMVNFVLLGLLMFSFYQNNNKKWLLILSWLFYVLGMLSHEAGIGLQLMILWQMLSMGSNLKTTLKIAIPYSVLAILYLVVRNYAGAVGLSGDYNYNLVNLPFNFAGNALGYLTVTLAGHNGIWLYEIMREFFKNEKMLALSVVMITTVIITANRKLLAKLFIGKFLFLTVMYLLALLPFLGLGNLSERYGLLASVFASMFLVYFGDKIVRFFISDTLKAKTAAIILFIILIGFYNGDIKRIGGNWQKAGDTSRKIVYAIKDNYRNFPPKTTLYFVNIPIKYGRSWIFPVGLKEAIWFIYRDKTLIVERLNTVDESFAYSDLNPNSHLFNFENGELKEVILK